MWKVVETETGEARIAEVERRRGQGGNKKKARRVRRKEAKEEKGGGRTGDLGQRRGSSKIRDRSKKDGVQEVSPMDKSIWEEAIREDANEEGVEPHDKGKREVCTEEGEGLSVIKGRERRSARIHQRTTKERVHQTLKVTPNSTSVLCREEE